jgi:uncharacterized RDD family membrane protein YckC
MESPVLGAPSHKTGLPPGVEVGPLGRRLVAYLIDSLVPGVAGGLIGFLLPGSSDTTRVMLGIVSALVTLGWALLVWFMLAVRAASPGMRVMKLQLVGFLDGRPLGWGRVLLRALVLWLVSLTGIGLVVMLVLLVMHPRKQGWHDLAVNAVVIRERMLAPPKSAISAAPARQPMLAPSPSAPVGSASVGPAPHGSASGAGPVSGPQSGYGSGQSAPLAAPRMGAPTPPVPVQPLTPPPGMGGYPTPVLGPSSAGAPPRTATQPPPGYHGPVPPPAAPVGPPAPASPPAESGWSAVLDDGRRLTVDGLVLLGRNPQPQPGEEDAQLVKLSDDTRTVSKSHLAIGLDPTGLYVMDRGSTNGSTVTTLSGQSTRCPPHEVVHVAEGSIVSIGDHWLEIRRAHS